MRETASGFSKNREAFEQAKADGLPGYRNAQRMDNLGMANRLGFH
jgi:hypothetical protein